MIKRVKQEKLEAMIKQCDGKLTIAETANLLEVSTTRVCVLRRRLGLVRRTSSHPTGMMRKERNVKHPGKLRVFWLSDETHSALRDWCRGQGITMSYWLETFIKKEIASDE